MASVTKNILHNIGTEVSAIDMSLTPDFVQAISGTPVVFSTQGTTSYDGSVVTVSWELKTPVGSATTLSISPDTRDAKVYPDVNGVYKVIATATNETKGVATASSFVVVTSVQTSIVREKPSSDFIGSSVSSFWKVLENKEVITSLWSEYISLLSGDYRKLGELVLSKSINTIQSGRVASNILVKPELDLSAYTHEIKLLPSFKGTKTAFFSLKPLTFEAAILSPTSIRLLNTGAAVASGINSGSVIEVFTTDSIGGKYTIKSSSSSDISLSVRTPVAGSTLKDKNVIITQTAGSNIVVLASTNQSTIEQGDYLIVQGVPCFIVDTPTTDTSLQTNEYRVTRNFTFNMTSYGYLYYTVPVSITPVEVGMTSKVYVPSDELGGHSKFIPTYDTPILEYVDRFTVKASNSLVPLYPGTTLKMLDVVAGTTTTIASSSYDSATGSVIYKIEPGLPESPFELGESVYIKTQIQNQDSIVGSLIYADTISAEIQSVDYIIDYYNKSYAAITVSSSEYLNGKTNADWRVCSTLTSTSLTDTIHYPEEGVHYGDLLRLEIVSSVTNKRSYLDCTIVAAYGNKVSLEFTTEELVNTIEPTFDQNGVTTDPLVGDLVTPSVNDAVVARVLNQVGIPRIALAGDGTYLFTSAASDIRKAVDNTISMHTYRRIECASFGSQQSTKRNTVYVTRDTEGNSLVRLSIVPTKVLRTGSVPMKNTADLVSIPHLTEFVYPKESSNIEGSTDIAILHEDGYVSRRSSSEVVLIENIDFFIQTETSFTGNDLTKSVGYQVQSEQGSFIERTVEPGDYLVVDSVTYTIKEVPNETTLTILEDTWTSNFEAVSFKNKTYTVKRKNALPVSYIRFRPGLFTPSSPAPPSFLAKVAILDNIHQVEHNFGRLVGYTIEDFYDFSSPQMSYLNAIRGLMYAITNGPTLNNIKLATSILLNLPVSDSISEIVSIDYDSGRIILQPVDSTTLQQKGPLDSYLFSTKETVLPFSSMSINPRTGSKYKVGDLVPRLTPLTGKVVVSDYVNTVFKFLTEFHTWKVSVDANSVDSRDLPLLAKFYDIAKPAHTKPEIELVLFLKSVVQVLVSFRIEAIIEFMDDPGFGLELTHAFDANNNSGQILRLADVGELSTVTLLLGRDLVVTSSTEVTSSRGGFVLDDPSAFTDDGGIGVQNDVKELQAYPPFSGTHFVRGKHLVRSGDILRIYSGKNHGIYRIDSVVSDTELTISPLQGYGIYTRTPEPDSQGSPPGIPLPNGAMFGIYRKVEDKILTNVTCTSVSSGNPPEATFDGEAFNWNRVSVGDVLVKTSDHFEKHVILDIVYDPIVEDASSKLKLASSPTSSESYFIYRDALIPQEYASGTITGSSSSQYRVQHDATDDQYKISIGDIIELTSGAEEGEKAVITYVEEGHFYINKPISSVGVEFKLLKEGREVEGEDPSAFPSMSYDSTPVSLRPYSHLSSSKVGAYVKRPLEDHSDTRLEYLHGYDDVSITLTSTSAMAQVGTAIVSPPENITRRELIGITNVSPTDTVLLYSGSTLVFEGSVLWIAGSSVMCVSISEHASLATSTSYTIEIKRSAAP